jgi:hypothetical protein
MPNLFAAEDELKKAQTRLLGPTTSAKRSACFNACCQHWDMVLADWHSAPCATYGRPLFSVTYKHNSLAAMLPIPAVSLKNIRASR